jgi:hypothetical protein
VERALMNLFVREHRLLVFSALAYALSIFSGSF